MSLIVSTDTIYICKCAIQCSIYSFGYSTLISYTVI